MTRFTAFDQSAATLGKSHSSTLQDTISLARHCEQLGYHRFWVAEHHNSPANVGTAPEIMCAAIAAVTGKIRVGSAGVLLSHYAPLKVAEQFRVLSAIAPGRIDLGIGRSPGGNPETQEALNHGRIARPYAALVTELLSWLDDAAPDTGTAKDILAYPRSVDGPEPWMLGSSHNGAMLAARAGIPFCFNYSHGANHHMVAAALDTYRSEYVPSRRFPHPLASLSIWVLAADTEAEAERLFAPRIYWRVMLDRGHRVPMVPPEVAKLEHLTLEERLRIDEMRGYSMVGSAANVASRIRDAAATHAVDEIVLGTWTYDPDDRLKSYSLLAQQFCLSDN